MKNDVFYSSLSDTSQDYMDVFLEKMVNNAKQMWIISTITYLVTAETTGIITFKKLDTWLNDDLQIEEKN